MINKMMSLRETLSAGGEPGEGVVSSAQPLPALWLDIERTLGDVAKTAEVRAGIVRELVLTHLQSKEGGNGPAKTSEAFCARITNRARDAACLAESRRFADRICDK